MARLGGGVGRGDVTASKDASGSTHATCVLVADDEPSNARLLLRIFERAGYGEIHVTSDAREVLPLYRSVRPDIVLIDLHMPHLDGFTLLDALRREMEADGVPPLVVITADPSSESRERAHRLGAHDYITKPYNAADLVRRVGNLAAVRRLYGRLRGSRGGERSGGAEDALWSQLRMLEGLCEAAEFHDGDVAGHTQRVGALSARLADALGLGLDEVEAIWRAAPLHDVGKIALGEDILLKPGPLVRWEFELTEQHTVLGASILSGSAFPLLQLAEEIALTHHERWDGRGYPRGLCGAAIPLSGRIVAVADVFDALTHARPYKIAWPVDRALEEIGSQRGAQFDPAVVDALVHVLTIDGARPGEHIPARSADEARRGQHQSESNTTGVIRPDLDARGDVGDVRRRSVVA